MVFSVAQSLNPKFSKLVGGPKTFGNFGFPCVFLDLQQKSKKTHGKFWIFSRNQKTHGNPKFQAKIKKIQNFQSYWAHQKLLEILDFHGNFWIFSRYPKKHMEMFGFSEEIQENTWKFLDFQQKSKKTHGKFWIFSRNQKTHGIFWIFNRNQKTHGIFWIFNRNPKKRKSKISKSFGAPNSFGNFGCFW